MKRRRDYFRGPGFERATKLVELLAATGKKYGKSAGQVAANWVLHTHGITVAVVGAKNIEQVKENTGRIKKIPCGVSGLTCGERAKRVEPVALVAFLLSFV